jgi:hypothetical protein
MQKYLLAVAASMFVVLLLGCGKPAADTSTQSSAQTFNAVQFCQDFASAPAELKTSADKAWMSIQSGAFPAALKCLGQLEANPALNEAQKKSVAGLTEQVKKQMAAKANAR